MAPTSSSGRPAYDTVTEVRFASTGSTRVCWVAASDVRRLVLAAPPSRGAPAPRRGERAAVTWIGAEGLRSLPVEFVAVQPAVVPLWHFRRSGPEVAAQRRTSVRVNLHVPIQVLDGARSMGGTTLDLSEGGVQCLVRTWPAPPPHGAALDMSMFLDGDRDPFRARGRLIRVQPGAGDESRLTLRFVELDDHLRDRLRAHVFSELRDQRAQGLL